MRCLTGRGWLLLVLLGAAPAVASDRIGDIEFFGYKGLDIGKLRETLLVHEGSEYSDRTKNQVRQAVADAIGKEPTDVAAICCDEEGNRLLLLAFRADRTRPSSTIQSPRAMSAFRRTS